MSIQNVTDWFKRRINVTNTTKSSSIALIWEMKDGSFVFEFFGLKPTEKHFFEKVSREVGLKKIKELNFTESKTLFNSLFKNAALHYKYLTDSKTCYFDNN